MKYTPTVSIVILNFNGINDTQTCIRSVLLTKYMNFKIIIVDNGSTVNEMKLLANEFRSRKIAWKRFKKNLGFAGANNKIMKSITSKYVALLNNDTTVDPLWLEKLIQNVEKDEKIAVCQSKIHSLTHRDYFEYAGAAGGLIDGLGYPYARGRIGFHLEQDNGQYNTVCDIFWASGTAMLIRRKVLKTVGLFDADLHSYVEEQDFCWRVKKAGYKVVFVASSVVYHKGLGSWGKYQTKKTFLIHRNNLMVLLEHMSLRRLVWVFPIRILMDYASIFYYIYTKRTDFILPVLLAHISLVAHIRKIVAKRHHPFWNRNRVIVEKEMWPISIMWEYFIKGKRKYIELFGKTSDVPVMYYGDMNTNLIIKPKV